MIAVTKIEGALQPGTAHKLGRILLVREHRLAQGQLVRIFLIIAGANEIPVIPLPNELGKRTTCEDRPVIEMRRNQRHDLPAMWLSRNGLLNDYVGFASGLPGQGCRCTSSKKAPPVHHASSTLTSGPRRSF